MFQKVALFAAAGLVTGASAQVDPGAFWPGYKRGQDRSASAVVQAGPAVFLEQTWVTAQPASVGGLTIGSDGNVYFKTRTGDGSLPRVYKIDPADGTILAESPPLDGDAGSYAGVVHGTNFLWTVVSSSASGSRVSKIVKLNYADLSVAGEFTNPVFDTPGSSLGLRGEPVLGTATNQRGNINLYVHSRGNTNGPTPSGLIHCVDSVTGDVDWSYDPMMDISTFFGKLGPSWVSGGLDHLSYFGNDTSGAGVCIRDNADGTFTEVWMGGPDNANWFGSGAMNDAQDTIYVTTYNDGGTPALWSIDAATGAQNWAVPGLEGTVNELEFFGRPAVMDDRVYAGGALGVIACFAPDGGGGFTQEWVVRPEPAENLDNPDLFVADVETRAAWATETDFFNSGNITSVAVADVASRGGPVRYVYAVMEQQPQETGADPFTTQLIVLRDDGNTATEILRTTLGDTMKPTSWGAGSPTLDADGTLYVVGGNASSTADAPGEIYKLVADVPCPADRNGDEVLDFFDLQDFLNDFVAMDPSADLNEDSLWDFFDLLQYLGDFSAGCP